MKNARIVEEIGRHVWAVTDAAMDAIVRIVTDGSAPERVEFFHGAIDSMTELRGVDAAAGAGTPNSYKFGQKAGSVGVISVEGPIVPRAGMEAVSQPRLTSAAEIQSDLAAMASDPTISQIAMVYDSPGGAVTGISELAAQIRAVEKPVSAYVFGMAASAAYWLASAADEIVSADTGMVGSIGVVATIGIDKAKDRVKIVSSQSPRKHADPETDDGRAVYQDLVDATAEVFVGAVAENRGTTRENVLETYGQGGDFLAGAALERGMIDRVSTFAEFMGGLQAGRAPTPRRTAGAPRRSAEKNTAQVELLDSGNQVTDYQNTGGEISAEAKKEHAMTLTEFLAQNAEAKAEYEAAILEAMKIGATAVRGELAFAARIAGGDSYPAPIRAMAVAVIAGEKSKDALDGAVTAFEALSEKKNSDEAVAASEVLPKTPAQAGETLSDDHVVRSEADFRAAVERARGVR